MQKFVKKPVVIEAVEYNGANKEEIEAFVGKKLDTIYTELKEPLELKIPTLEGDMKASKGDYIIKGIKGEFYPCKPDIFKSTYNVVEDNNGILSEGEKRVRTTFNVLSLATVDIAKQLMAEAINLLSRDQNDVASYYYDNLNTTQYRELSADYQREVATAKTKIEEAAMWTVKALTNDIHVVDFNSSTKVEDATIPPHQKRVIEEQVELETKYTNLKIFITNNPIFKSLNEEEQLRLSSQLKVMEEYNNILKDRINNFNNG